MAKKAVDIWCRLDKISSNSGVLCILLLCQVNEQKQQEPLEDITLVTKDLSDDSHSPSGHHLVENIGCFQKTAQNRL